MMHGIVIILIIFKKIPGYPEILVGGFLKTEAGNLKFFNFGKSVNLGKVTRLLQPYLQA